VAWTPEGYYSAQPGAFRVVRWHVNRSVDEAGTTVAVSDIAGTNRPDLLPLVLQELDTDAAVSLAQKIAMRRAVQNATGAPKPPGTRLHVLTIGITKYGANAENFNLKYANRDAHDLVDTLLRTQSGGPYGGGMYADVKPTYMPDGIAKKRAILEALYAMANTMNPDDFAVVMFAGHGAMMGGEFYLLPHDVDVSTPVGFTESTIS